MKIGNLPKDLASKLNTIAELDDYKPAFRAKLEENFKRFDYFKARTIVEDNFHISNHAYDQKELEHAIIEGLVQYTIYQSYTDRIIDFSAYVESGFNVTQLLYLGTKEWQKKNNLTNVEVEWLFNTHDVLDTISLMSIEDVVDNNFDFWIEELRQEQNKNPEWMNYNDSNIELDE
jgi:hypothetical protein